MANLYGRLRGSRGEATRCGHDTITARVENWEHSVSVTLDVDGTYTVLVGDKSDPRYVIAGGSLADEVSAREVSWPVRSDGACTIHEPEDPACGETELCPAVAS